jgi:hypothetical protein
MRAELRLDTSGPGLTPGRILGDIEHRVVVVVLSGPLTSGRLRYAGAELVASRPIPCGASARRPDVGRALRPGRRYVDEPSGLQVRCVHGDPRPLRYAGRSLTPVPAAE